MKTADGIIVGAGFLAFTIAGCRVPTSGSASGGPTAPSVPRQRRAGTPVSAPPRTPAERIVRGARIEAEHGALYDARYARISYPGGDVPPDRGACTDVVIRSLRHAGHDLQRLIHEDMRRHFRLYPRRYGLRRPDPNIDHRRVSNQMVFMRRFGMELPLATTGPARAAWQPGDVVYWMLDSGMEHCGILTDERNGAGLPLVVHNLSVTRQEDCLERWRIIGHFRFPRVR